MTMRLRESQQGALAAAHVGRFLAERMRPLAKESTYDERLRSVRVVGHRDQVVTFKLDDRGNVIQLETPLRRVTRYGYESGLQTSALLPTGLEIRTAYDAEGRPVRCERSDGESQHLAYDAAGKVRLLSFGAAAPLQFAYDEQERPRRVTERDGTAVNHVYDEAGRLTTIVDPLGRETRLEYGEGPEPTRWHEPDGTRLQYRYGESIEEQVNGQAHASYAFDPAGRLASATYADGYSFAFERDD